MAFNGHGQRVKFVFGNISEAEFVTHLGPRELKHGGIKFKFGFGPVKWDNACEEVEAYLENKDLVRGRDYNIPVWNKSNSYGYGQTLSEKLGGFYITFVDDETFVMSKMTWDIDQDEN